MGLDMYLYKRTYVKNWKHDNPEDKVEITVKRGGEKHPTIDTDKVTYIQEEVGYWRKANQIHKWFVDNVQNGVDECQESWVDESKLKELLQICHIIRNEAKLVEGDVANGYTIGKDMEKIPILEKGKVMKGISAAMELLPTESGFFFGGTDYDEYYMQDIENTIKILEEEMKKIDNPVQGCIAEYYYRSSW